MNNRFVQSSIYISMVGIIFFLSGCAKQVAPTGGPIDKEHPLIVEMNPQDNTVNFDKSKITITFNEYIQLKDLNNSLIISPPVEEKPEIKVKGKELEINFLEDLRDSTTYNIYFGNAIQDYNEGNAIENFQYVLSTGPEIDSLSISGQVINSFTLLPEDGVFVMLYKELEDSVPMKQIPTYLSKTDKEGYFHLNNIGHDEYKLFCLRDLNRNYLFDLPNEEIAFVDSLVQFELITDTLVDTLYVPDSIYILNEKELPERPDERAIDTIITRVESYFQAEEYVLTLFEEYNEVQYLKNNTRDIKQKIELVFNKPIQDSIIFSLVDTTVNKNWFTQEVNSAADSINYWLTDSSIYNKERLLFAVTYQKEDSNMVYQWNTDTLNLRFVEEELPRNQEPDTSINFAMNIKNRGTMDLNKDLRFQFETPVESYDTTKMDLYAVIDTIDIPVNYSFIKDSSKHRGYAMQVEWSPDSVYRLEIYPNAFKDIYGTVNDTTIVLFDTQKQDFYGNVFIDVAGMDSIPEYQLICQLVISKTDSETVFEEKIIQNNQLVEFNFLPPKEFMFKAILDKNFNGKWDTGEYLKHLQPEEVLYHDEIIKVRSNWDIEVNFNVNK